MNKASGGDGIPVEIFQILKDDAAKVLHSIRQQIWKSPVATAEFSKLAGVVNVALSQHHLLGFEISQLEFHHLH